MISDVLSQFLKPKCFCSQFVYTQFTQKHTPLLYKYKTYKIHRARQGREVATWVRISVFFLRLTQNYFIFFALSEIGTQKKIGIAKKIGGNFRKIH